MFRFLSSFKEEMIVILEENKSYTSLEDLGRMFSDEKEKEKRSRALATQKKARILIILIGVLIAVFLMLFAIFHGRGQEKPVSKIENIPGFLTEEEENNWETKKVDKNEVFIIVNTNLEVRDGEVELNLANPPYSAYPLQIEITNDFGETVYYQSDVINPEKYLDKVKLQNIPTEAGTYPVNIHYTFFAEKGSKNVVGEHTVAGEIIIRGE